MSTTRTPGPMRHRGWEGRKRKLAGAVLAWFSASGRTLPWRFSSSPYRILISEIMLQQTQVSRVREKFPKFLRCFPSLRSLALAPQRDVVMAWEGMGYNNRAVRLHALARKVTLEFNGRLPGTYDALTSLPGIGRYTANAILSSSFGLSVPVVDINVRRVFSRLFWRMSTTADMRPEAEIWRIAEEILPPENAYEWNQALMDLGATICTARSPRCPDCPVRRHCASTRTMKNQRQQKSRREPMFNGVPNRIHRGRIVQVLRSAGHSMRASELAQRVVGTRTIEDPWWLGVLAGLQRDGLVTMNRSKVNPMVTLA